MVLKFDGLFAARCTWQLKRPGLESLVPDAVTVLIPIQNLDPVAPPIQEQEEMA
jgi:hypothetical protein